MARARTGIARGSAKIGGIGGAQARGARFIKPAKGFGGNVRSPNARKRKQAMGGGSSG